MNKKFKKIVSILSLLTVFTTFTTITPTQAAVSPEFMESYNYYKNHFNFNVTQSSTNKFKINITNKFSYTTAEKFNMAFTYYDKSGNKIAVDGFEDYITDDTFTTTYTVPASIQNKWSKVTVFIYIGSIGFTLKTFYK